MSELTKRNEYEMNHIKQLINFYLKYGSVEEAMKRESERVFVSQASYHRILDQFGIVKSAGRYDPFHETISFLMRMTLEKIPHAYLYNEMPYDFENSFLNLNLVIRAVRKGLVTKTGAALVITPEGSNNSVLIGEEISSRSAYKKKVGDMTVPMGFAKQGEPLYFSLLRLLQQEVSNPLAVNGQLAPYGEIAQRIIEHEPNPFMYLDIADVRVAVCHLVLPEELCNANIISSHRLLNHRFMSGSTIAGNSDNPRIRAGIPEIMETFVQTEGRPVFAPPVRISRLNNNLSRFPVKPNSLKWTTVI
ncbi:MAG: hypothetical protein US11_C0006G0001 [Candidatus Roizmanbacteria bacterium GW2011_GWA2_36_23]|uniref:Uncharacterized protein n=1 Tax=Candidatus Roizmanbacteria bacterium GW2011_GWA2_36_23 TaxID=1618480 RepID=A0A0G0GP13_9BACT|nr:MAG: hypothetical protein US11_C0006G0001 [Candidatus Roizmanbacteria bacterium GW2011_GWA2_36_23]